MTPDATSLTREPYDLVIIGGGITGAGAARDAALRGLRVAMFEKGDFGSGTSSKSSKLIHGGLRYLEHGEIGLVFESVSERRVQMRVAPHLVRPQAFLVPIYKDSRPGLELMNLGLWIYDSLALFRSPRMHKTFRGARAAELEPQIKTDGLKGIIEYYDCATDDARLVLENVLDARAAGARCDNYHQVVRLERDDRGRVTAVIVRDAFGGGEERVPCRAVVLAAGAWTDEMIARFEVPVGRPLLRRTKGVHLVFPAEKLPVSRAITLISSVDGRVMFVIPWRGRTVVGTTDTDFEGTADEVWADAADARYLCDSVNAYFPHAKVSPDDVIATWAGLRPLIRPERAGKDESETSREHEVFTRDDGIVIVAGGKLTTYRRMAREVVGKAVKWLRERDPSFRGNGARAGTKHRALPGAQGLDEPTLAAVARVGQRLIAEHGLDADTATHLCGVYGVRAELLGRAIAADRALGERLNPDAPYVWAEVDFAVEHDLARTVEDVLGRRVPLLLVGRGQGLDVCERVADRIAARLGWSDAERARQLDAYRAEVADSRRFRTAP